MAIYSSPCVWSSPGYCVWPGMAANGAGGGSFTGFPVRSDRLYECSSWSFFFLFCRLLFFWPLQSWRIPHHSVHTCKQTTLWYNCWWQLHVSPACSSLIWRLLLPERGSETAKKQSEIVFRLKYSGPNFHDFSEWQLIGNARMKQVSN